MRDTRGATTGARLFWRTRQSASGNQPRRIRESWKDKVQRTWGFEHRIPEDASDGGVVRKLLIPSSAPTLDAVDRGWIGCHTSPWAVDGSWVRAGPEPWFPSCSKSLGFVFGCVVPWTKWNTQAPSARGDVRWSSSGNRGPARCGVPVLRQGSQGQTRGGWATARIGDRIRSLGGQAQATGSEMFIDFGAGWTWKEVDGGRQGQVPLCQWRRSPRPAGVVNPVMSHWTLSP
ncbi:hypothetical protein B0J13DRAFT_520174 [Dactylonectria estremocensis]|uniref:Uncharacterized protein n=1 Tax=Dactylonectria estremocensis TaxID=1079267 RepID=A0A9P9FB29_9HYPO|nr:hypothetical protein B0J13DRAFT_520174 [Dactylonectria estremocensis]